VFHRSDRLLLRPVWPEDWKGILGEIADQAIVRNLASAPWPYREDDARAFTQLPIEPLYPRFVMTRADDACVVGCIGIDVLHAPDTVDTANTVELGYWIGRDHWGQGYATEAGRAVLTIARAIGHKRVIAGHFEDNPASGRVLRKLGFTATGRRLMRHSCGRGEEAETIEYALDLTALDDAEIAPMPAPMPAVTA